MRGNWVLTGIVLLAVVVGMYFAVFPHSAFAINSILFNDQTEFDFDYDQKLFEQHFLDNYGNIPLSFEINDGQTDERVEFLSRGNDYTIYLTSNDVVLSFTKLTQQDGENKNSNVKFINDVVGIELVGSNQESQISGLQQISTKSNYFIGNDLDNWQKDISHFSKVLYKEIYPGTDLVFYGNQHQLEFDFVVYPGADPDNIKLDFKGVEKLSLDSSGNLILHVSDKKVVLKAPIVYQEINGIKKIILSHYEITDGKKVGFVLGDYDHNNILIIDPVLVYSTYLGGSNTDRGLGIAVDSSGNAYIVGNTESIDFPTVNPFQPTKGSNIFSNDVFVAKLNAAGNAFVYITYLGGISGDNAGDITVDSAGNAYLIGDTRSTDFPTFNAIQPSLIGIGVISDMFVTKLNTAGNALIYSTYLGGTGGDQGKGIAVDLGGNVYLTGSAGNKFPTTSGVIKPIGGNDAIVTKINPSGSVLVYSTYLGGSKSEVGHDIAVDSSGNAYIVGKTVSLNFPTTPGAFQTAAASKGDAFVSKLNPTATALVYSTYLGGSKTDTGLGIAVDSSRNAYVVGNTFSANFPTVNPIQTNVDSAFDGFAARLNPAGSALIYSTYLSGGGPAFNSANDVAVDSSGNAYVIGEVSSSINFPTANAIQSIGGGSDDAFVAKLNPAGNAIYSTFLGGSSIDHGNGIALDASGSAYITGVTCSTNFPLANPIQSIKNGGCDAFVAKIGEDPLQNVIDELQNIIDDNSGTPLADKIEDAKVSDQTAINELNKTPPDNQAAAGNIEGAVGSLEDAIKDNSLDPSQGEQLIDQLLDVSRQLAVDAIDTANNTPGSDAGKISSANAALANGDSLRAPITSFGDFKSAAAAYKVAIAEAEGALP